jgi:hypothetical protein
MLTSNVDVIFGLLFGTSLRTVATMNCVSSVKYSSVFTDLLLLLRRRLDELVTVELVLVRQIYKKKIILMRGVAWSSF